MHSLSINFKLYKVFIFIGCLWMNYSFNEEKVNKQAGAEYSKLYKYMWVGWTSFKDMK
jgi:hypothetical protein